MHGCAPRNTVRPSPRLTTPATLSYDPACNPMHRQALHPRAMLRDWRPEGLRGRLEGNESIPMQWMWRLWSASRMPARCAPSPMCAMLSATTNRPLPSVREVGPYARARGYMRLAGTPAGLGRCGASKRKPSVTIPIERSCSTQTASRRAERTICFRCATECCRSIIKSIGRCVFTATWRSAAVPVVLSHARGPRCFVVALHVTQATPRRERCAHRIQQ